MKLLLITKRIIKVRVAGRQERSVNAKNSIKYKTDENKMYNMCKKNRLDSIQNLQQNSLKNTNRMVLSFYDKEK